MHLDAAGVAGNGLVHGIVDHLGEQVMQGIGVGAADIHAGAAANRLETFQHLDIGSRIAALGRRGTRGGLLDRLNRCFGADGARVAAEKVVCLTHELSMPKAESANFAL